MADINITNLVDVMLVLLIVFMISAPMIQAGIDIALPKASEAPVETTNSIIISIDKTGKIYIDNYPIPANDFESRLTTIRSVKKGRPIFIRADKTVPYGTVIELMGHIKKLGIEDVGLITEPETRL